MERSRRGEGNDHTSQPLPPVGKADQRLTTELPVPGAAADDLSDLEDLDTPTIPGYLTLEELDVSDFQGVAPEAGAAPTQTDWAMHGLEDPEVPSLEFPELCEPEGPTIPGYLTLESDLNVLADDLPWQSPNNVEADEPRGKP